MKRLTSQEISRLDAQDGLEDAITTSAALLESMAELMTKSLTGDCMTLSSQTVHGLRLLAGEQCENLRGRFDELVEAVRDAKGGAN